MAHSTLLRNLCLLLPVCACLACGCSTFETEWEAAAASATRGGLEGRWQGTWTSDQTKQSGKLRCIIRSGLDGNYEARLRSGYGLIFSSDYTVPIEVAEERRSWRFAGKLDLGAFGGGEYQLKGRIEGDELRAGYQTEYDHGKYRLTRVPPSDPGK